MACRLSGADLPLRTPPPEALPQVLSESDGGPRPQAMPIEGPQHLAPVVDGLRALARGESRLLRMTQFGDSHTAPDLFTGRMRQLLQQRFGNAGPGFVLLGKPWPSYTHRQIKQGASRGWRAERLWGRYSRRRPPPRDDLFGVAGVSVHAKQPATAWLALRRGHGPTAPSLGSLDLFFLKQPTGGELALYSGGTLLGHARTLGETLGPGFQRFELPPETRRLDLSAHSGEVRLFGADLRVAGGTSGVLYDALGLNGATAVQTLAWNPSLLEAHLVHLAPDLLVLAYGSNEVDNRLLTAQTYTAKLDQVLTHLRALAPRASCLLIGPPDRAKWVRREGWKSPENLGFIVDEQRRQASRHACAFWDQRQAMGGPGAIFTWVQADPPLAFRDHVHLTTRGYDQLADELFAALIRLVEDSRSSPPSSDAGR